MFLEYQIAKMRARNSLLGRIGWTAWHVTVGVLMVIFCGVMILLELYESFAGGRAQKQKKTVDEGKAD